MSGIKTADELRATFLKYFQGHGHRYFPPANLVPTHAAAPLFINSGMVAFLPYFLGEEAPPTSLMTSCQPCVRVRGKHDDIEVIGRTTRHLTFFEMLGNFSFGEYFKEGAISYAWDFLTNVLGLSPDRLWATVYDDDDEAVELWRSVVGLPPERIQRMKEDNFWEMGSTGPCGPSSEIFFDKGPRFGEEGGPARGGEERYVEIWNLVFMQYNRLPDGTLEDLPRKNIDTGAGFDRILPILQDVDSVFETDVLRRLISDAERLCGARYGVDAETDVSLRIVADHSRAITFLLSDGVIPSNEERGYVLRRLIRRAALHARRAGADRPVLADAAATVAEVMHAGYPDLTASLPQVQEMLEMEEHRFYETLTMGLGVLDRSLPDSAPEVPGDLAFKLHDTYGFPIDLTKEVAESRGMTVDVEGFEAAMAWQRQLAKSSAKTPDPGDTAVAKEVLDTFGTTSFLGYTDLESRATSARLVPTGSESEIEMFVDRTPFYPEGGGQVGDVGTVSSDGAVGEVLDTDAPLPGVIRHRVAVQNGTFADGEEVVLRVDSPRRDAVRRSHTGTHLLHWAIREVLGPNTHQQGSLVAPDYLRFDFNHHSPLTEDEVSAIETLVSDQILTNSPVQTKITSYAEAKAEGALSFFGEKYGETVRVVHAGEHSTELCGGTHVGALGDIGEFVVQSESSVGANLRRIEAVVGRTAHENNYRQRSTLRDAARLLHTTPADVVTSVQRLQDSQRASERERRAMQAKIDAYLATELVAHARDSVVVQRVDGRTQIQLKQLAAKVLAEPGVEAVGLVGTPDSQSVAIAVSVADASRDAPSVARAAAKAVGGGGGGKEPLSAVAGGKDVTAIGEALTVLGDALVAPS